MAKLNWDMVRRTKSLRGNAPLPPESTDSADVNPRKWHEQRAANQAARQPQKPPSRSINQMVDRLFGRRK